MKTYRIAIIGTGRVGYQFTKRLSAKSRWPSRWRNAEWVADQEGIVDVNDVVTLTPKPKEE